MEAAVPESGDEGDNSSIGDLDKGFNAGKQTNKYILWAGFSKGSSKQKQTG